MSVVPYCPGTAHRFAPRSRRRQVELQLLSVSQRDEYDRIAARSHKVTGQSDHGKCIAPELDLLSEHESGAAVSNGLVTAANDWPAFVHQPRLAWPCDLCTDDQQPLGLPTMLRFDVLIGDAASRGNPPLRGYGDARIPGNPRSLGEGTARSAFHDPNLPACCAHEPERFHDQAAIDSDHRKHNAEKKAEPEARQQEAAEIVTDVFESEVHFMTRRNGVPHGLHASRSGRRPPLPPGTSEVIWIRPSSNRSPSCTGASRSGRRVVTRSRQTAVVTFDKSERDEQSAWSRS